MRKVSKSFRELASVIGYPHAIDRPQDVIRWAILHRSPPALILANAEIKEAILRAIDGMVEALDDSARARWIVEDVRDGLARVYGGQPWDEPETEGGRDGRV